MTETATFYVSRGRTVSSPEGNFGPGELVTIPAKDVERLKRLGFIQDERPILNVAVPGSNPAAIGPHNRSLNPQGPTYPR